MVNLIRLALVFFAFSQAFAQIDALGRDVKVAKSDKLVFVGPGALRYGVYLGLEDRIVGIEHIEGLERSGSPYNKILKKKNLHKLPIIGEGGPGKMPFSEALINSGADLIIASFIDESSVKSIEQKTKIPVFVVGYGEGYGSNARKLDAVKQSLLALGEVTNSAQRAKKLVEFIQKEQDALKALKIAPKSVYVGGVSYKGAWGIESTESDYLPFLLLGIENAVKSSRPGHLITSMENIVNINPETIFLDKGGLALIEKQKSENKALFESLRAFKNGRIHLVEPLNFYNTNVENCFIAAWQIAVALGQEANLDEKKARIYKAFLGDF